MSLPSIETDLLLTFVSSFSPSKESPDQSRNVQEDVPGEILEQAAEENSNEASSPVSIEEEETEDATEKTCTDAEYEESVTASSEITKFEMRSDDSRCSRWVLSNSSDIFS